MTSILNDFDRVAEALVKQHAPAHSIKAPDGRMTSWRRSYYGADQADQWQEWCPEEAYFTADYEEDEDAEESWR
jgi:hypothetical protein